MIVGAHILKQILHSLGTGMVKDLGSWLSSDILDDSKSKEEEGSSSCWRLCNIEDDRDKQMQCTGDHEYGVLCMLDEFNVYS